MDPHTRQQLLELSRAFYAAHAEGFDASRGHQPWPGWQRLLAWLPQGPRLRVLDVGCGNARLASFLGAELEQAGRPSRLEYVGLDANAALLAAARERLPAELAARCRLVESDFLDGETPGAGLPEGPFELVALMGVLHHVPGADWRRALLAEAAARLAAGGILAVASWQFAGRPRFEARRVAWDELAPVLGDRLDPTRLEPGDQLLRFGADPDTPPRYCHQVSEAEFDGWPAALGLETLERYAADGGEGDLNRYWILRRA